MTKIIEFPRRLSPEGSESREDSDVVAWLRAVKQSVHLAAADVESAIEMIQAQLESIREQIDAIPDADVLARLAREHAILTEALQYARKKVVSLKGCGL